MMMMIIYMNRKNKFNVALSYLLKVVDLEDTLAK